MKISNRTPHTLLIDGERVPVDPPPIRLPFADMEEVYGLPFPAVRANAHSLAVAADAAQEILDDGGDLVLVARLVLDVLLQHAHRDADIARALSRVASPDTSPTSAVRDAEGRITGVRRIVIAPVSAGLGPREAYR